MPHISNTCFSQVISHFSQQFKVLLEHQLELAYSYKEKQWKIKLHPLLYLLHQCSRYEFDHYIFTFYHCAITCFIYIIYCNLFEIFTLLSLRLQSWYISIAVQDCKCIMYKKLFNAKIRVSRISKINVGVCLMLE